jgi:competence protein ComEA
MMSLTRKERIFAVLALGFALLFVGVVWWVNRPQEKAPVVFVVQIEGGVHRPGVYRVPEGTRVYELIERAGGIKEGADLSGLNLAAPLYDGQKIAIPFAPPPSSGEVPEGASSQVAIRSSVASSSLINVNTASSKELESLPGIGEVLAQRIVEYRETHGPFQNPEDLLKVKGIGPKKLENIRDRITF